MSTAVPVLLVEDSEAHVFFLTRLLHYTGLTWILEVARDGQEAIDYLAGTGRFRDRRRYPMPRLMLLDLNLPVKSGFEVLAWCFAQKLDLFTVVLTASADERDIARAYELGARSYLVKPPTTEAMRELALLFRTHHALPDRRDAIRTASGQPQPSLKRAAQAHA